jgi:hypothetical protein
VEYSAVEEATRAMNAMDGVEIEGRRVRVNFAPGEGSGGSRRPSRYVRTMRTIFRKALIDKINLHLLQKLNEATQSKQIRIPWAKLAKGDLVNWPWPHNNPYQHSLKFSKKFMKIWIASTLNHLL